MMTMMMMVLFIVIKFKEFNLKVKKEIMKFYKLYSFMSALRFVFYATLCAI